MESSQNDNIEEEAWCQRGGQSTAMERRQSGDREDELQWHRGGQSTM